jgi:hypothetical protein
VQAIGTVRGFVQAFSRHDVKAALAFFASFPGSSRLPAANDCDYRTGRSVAFAGSAEVARWLRQRAADHDRLTIASIRLIGPRPSGAAIYYSLRTSDSIKARGYPEGLKPNIATKAIFAARGPVRLTTFANDNGVDRPCGP